MAETKQLSIKRVKIFIQKKILKDHTQNLDLISKSHIGLWITIATGVGFFLELMMIRIHSSYFQLFAYLKNISLLSCFLGLGIGYALSKKKPVYTPFVLPLLSLQVIILFLLRSSKIAPLLQNPFSEQLSLGLNQTVDLKHTLFVFGFVVAIFVYNALCFIPLGHLASYLMTKVKPLRSYGWNLIGSLGGIILFSLLSLLWSPPLVWFVIGTILLLPFLYKNHIGIILTAASVAAVTIILSLSFKPNTYDIFSPYQILTLMHYRDTPAIVMTSNSYY
ncbi:MAG: hypothetical protein GYA62_01845, partial [Bacteroidales bacterium]|nr:hypothetical protein [Bacteroidales bacterium]